MLTRKQLQDISDILAWAKKQAKTDELYNRICANKELVDYEIMLFKLTEDEQNNEATKTAKEENQ